MAFFSCFLFTINRDVRFNDVENLHVYSSWSTTAKVVSGQIKETRSGNIVYRAVLIDLSVSNHSDAKLSCFDHNGRCTSSSIYEVALLDVPVMYHFILHVCCIALS